MKKLVLTFVLLTVHTSAQVFAQAELKPELVVQSGHAALARPLGFSADGRLLVTVGAGGALTRSTVKLWDAATGRELKTLFAESTDLRVELSPDGRTLASGGRQEYVRLWDVATGRELTPGGECCAFGYAPFAFSPDGKALVSRNPRGGNSGNNDQSFLHDVKTGQLLGFLPVTSNLLMALSYGGRLAAFPTEGGPVKLWDVAANEEMENHRPWVGDAMWVAFSPDGTTYAALSNGNGVTLVETATGRSLWTRTGPAKNWGESFQFSPDGKRIAGCVKEFIKVWDVATGRELQTLSKKGSFFLTLWFSPDGETLAARTYDKEDEELTLSRHTFTLWDLATGTELARDEVPSTKGVTSCKFSPDSQTLALGCVDGNMKLWSPRRGAALKTLGRRSGTIPLVAFSVDGKTLVRSTGAGFALGPRERLMLSLASMFLKGELFEGQDYSGLFEDVLSMGSTDYDLKLWDLSGRHGPQRLRGHEGEVTAAVFSPDGRVLATAAEDTTVRLWDAATGRALRTLRGHTARPNAIAFSKDGKTLASGSFDGLLRLWDISTGAVLKTFKASSLCAALAFSPDGKTLAATYLTSDTKTRIRILNIDTEEVLMNFEGGKVLITSVAFSDDGRTLASTSINEGSVRLWEVSSGKELKALPKGDASTVREVFAAVPDFYHNNYDETVTADGHVHVTRGGGRLNFAELKTGRLLASLVPLDESDWAVVAPDGRFDTNKLENPEGLHWLIPDAPLTPLSFEVFMRDYFEPKLLLRLLRCAQESSCAEEFKPLRDLSLLNRTQPSIRISRITPASPGTVEVRVEVGNVDSQHQKDSLGRPLSSGVYDVRLFRDGQLVGYTTPGDKLGATFRTYENFEEELAVWRDANRVDLSAGVKTLTFTVNLPAAAAGAKVEFMAYAFNNDRVKSETAGSTYAITGADVVPRRKRAYVITFGVSKYESPEWDLQYAGNDARAMGSVFVPTLRRAGVFDEVIAIPLISDDRKVGSVTVENRHATKANMQTVLELLGGKTPGKERLKAIEKAIGPRTLRRLRQTNPGDMVLLSFSAHGFADRDGVFHIVPSDIGGHVGKRITDALLKRLISSDELSLWLRDVDAGEMVMVVDACYAAAAVEGGGFKPAPMGSRGLGQLAFDKGMKILAATQAADLAVEAGGSIRHGLLSYALLREGIGRGAADFRARDGAIGLGEWLAYGEFRVPRLYEEIALGRLKSAGARQAGGAGAAATQQPSLFDFTRKKTEVTLVRLQ